MKNQRYIMVISFDGLAASDWDTLQALPNFRRFLAGAGYCRNVYSVYPSVTYPAHVSIMTGRYPAHHGVINNTRFQPNRLTKPEWCWDRRLIHGKTLYELAREKGMTTAAYLWPVTGRARITYNLPEVFSNRWWDNQVLASLRRGSFWFQIQAALRFGNMIKGARQPQLDNFLHETVKYALRSRSPQVNFVHYVDLDATRHLYGHNSPEADQALRRHDARLGELLDEFVRAGLDDQVTWVILGDHSSIDEHTAVYLNQFFWEQGWLQPNQKGGVRWWKVICQHCDGSAYIYVKSPDLVEPVRSALERFSQENGGCIEQILTGQEARELGATDTCTFMVEARRGYYFLDACGGRSVYPIQEGDVGRKPHITKSTHGYSPYKPNYTTLFAMRGRGIAEGEVLSSMELVDEAPTMARLIGGTLPEADGRERIEFWKGDVR